MCQAPIRAFRTMTDAPFRDALKAHMRATGTRVSDLVRQSGVSRSVIEKFLKDESDPNRRNRIALDDALAIVRSFHLTAEQFLQGPSKVDVRKRLRAKLDQLSDAEAELLMLQVEGILARRPRAS